MLLIYELNALCLMCVLNVQCIMLSEAASQKRLQHYLVIKNTACRLLKASDPSVVQVLITVICWFNEVLL